MLENRLLLETWLIAFTGTDLLLFGYAFYLFSCIMYSDVVSFVNASIPYLIANSFSPEIVYFFMLLSIIPGQIYILNRVKKQ